MKLFNTYTLLIVGILFFSSCEEDYLNIENPNDLSAASFWATEGEMQHGLVATYGALQLQGMLGGSSSIQHLFARMLVDPIIGTLMRLDSTLLRTTKTHKL